jgi:hypothetical protein
MSDTNAFQRNISSLPDALRVAQESIDLPEVQEMLRKLSKYNLGISMPHMHNEETGDFQPLPKELVQVEADLKVSFSPIEEIPEEIQGQTIRYVPVAWFWRDTEAVPVTVASMCYSYCEVPVGHTNHVWKHRQQ